MNIKGRHIGYAFLILGIVLLIGLSLVNFATASVYLVGVCAFFLVTFLIKRLRKGVRLLELLLVVIVICIIAAIAIPNLLGERRVVVPKTSIRTINAYKANIKQN